MPITVTAPEGVLTPAGEREILPRLSAALVEASGATGNSFFTAIVGGTVHILPLHRIYAGGANRPVVMVELKLPNIGLGSIEARKASSPRPPALSPSSACRTTGLKTPGSTSSTLPMAAGASATGNLPLTRSSLPQPPQHTDLARSGIMRLSPSLFFTTNCEPALAFYERCGLGRGTILLRWGDNDMPVRTEAMRGEVLHARFEGPGVLFHASDNDDAEPMKGSALCWNSTTCRQCGSFSSRDGRRRPHHRASGAASLGNQLRHAG